MIKLIFITWIIFFIHTINLFTQWQKCDIELPDIGIYAIAFKNEIIFAATMGNGILISTDTGNSWVEKNNGISDLYIRTIAINNNYIFIGTSYDGIFLSNDMGDNWLKKSIGLTGNIISSFAFSNEFVFASTWDAGVFFSSNYGDNWFEKNNGLFNTFVTSIAIQDSNIFAGTNGSGIYYSNDLGKNWFQSKTGISENIIIPITITGNYIFIGTYSSQQENSGFVYRSSNNGELWSRMIEGIPDVKINSLASLDSVIIAGTYGSGVFISTNYGETWIERNLGLETEKNKNILSIALNKEDVFIGTWGNIFKSKLSDLITGIHDINSTNTYLKIYPNPSNDLIFINSSENIKFNSIKIYNLLGIQQEISKKENLKIIDITNLSVGVYILECNNQSVIFIKN